LIVVRGLAVTAVKGTRLLSAESVMLERDGVRANRRFFLIDERDRMVNGKQIAELSSVIATYDEPAGTLNLTFPDGRVIGGPVTVSETVSARFFSRTVEARLVEGPLSAALSAHTGRQLRLVEALGSIDRGRGGAASLISRASLTKLADVAGRQEIDPRRFRMLIEVEGIAAHAEDDWIGARVRIGDAIVRWGGHVGRCLVTGRDPDTGVVDVPTLELLRSYRGQLETTEPLAFGIFGEVVQEGMIRVGDPVVPDGYASGP
jgi:MOSC domain-containing protein